MVQEIQKIEYLKRLPMTPRTPDLKQANIVGRMEHVIMTPKIAPVKPLGTSSMLQRGTNRGDLRLSANETYKTIQWYTVK